MNAYNPLESMKRLEASGLPRSQAEAIAAEINDNSRDLVTKAYLKEQLKSENLKLTIRLGGLVGAMIAVATGILGILISIK